VIGVNEFGVLVRREEEVAERILLTGIGVDKVSSSVLPFEFELRDLFVGLLVGPLRDFGCFCISGLRVEDLSRVLMYNAYGLIEMKARNCLIAFCVTTIMVWSDP
jgi:hypothetical protein